MRAVVTSWAVLPLGCALLALAALAPVLRPGFVLVYDMVFTPEQPLTASAFGLGSALPRAVPVDAVVALASRIVPGDVLQKIALFGAVFGAALGAGRLVPTESTGIRLVAATAYAWNPYVAERLFLGHWTLLLGYAALPWVAHAGLRWRHDEPRAWARLVLASLPALLSAPGGLLALGVALAAVGRRKALPVLGLAVVLNAPWWVPSVLRSASALSDPNAVLAFGARAENWGGPVLSVLGLGGIWNAEVTPASRANPVLPLLVVVMVAAALYGLRVLVERWHAGRGLVVLGALGVLLAVLGTVPLGADLLSWAGAHVPGAGLLRDGQKWVAWWALPFALGFALAVEAGAARLRTSGPAIAAAVLLPIGLLPDLLWGGFGRLEPVHYPAEWSVVRQVLADDGRPGDVAVLPLSTFRRFGWNDRRTQLDPAPRLLPRTTITDDSLPVDGVVVAGDDPRAAELRKALADGTDLGSIGVGWVLVEHNAPSRVDVPAATRWEPVHQGEWLSLYRIPGPIAAGPIGPAALPVVAAWVTALVAICASLLWLGLPTGRFGRPKRSSPVTEE
jgi:hypothetical protein